MKRLVVLLVVAGAAVALLVRAEQTGSSAMRVLSAALFGAVAGYFFGVPAGAQLEAERQSLPPRTIFGGG